MIMRIILNFWRGRRPAGITTRDDRDRPAGITRARPAAGYQLSGGFGFRRPSGGGGALEPARRWRSRRMIS